MWWDEMRIGVWDEMKKIDENWKKHEKTNTKRYGIRWGVLLEGSGVSRQILSDKVQTLELTARVRDSSSLFLMSRLAFGIVSWSDYDQRTKMAKDHMGLENKKSHKLESWEPAGIFFAWVQFSTVLFSWHWFKLAYFFQGASSRIPGFDWNMRNHAQMQDDQCRDSGSKVREIGWNCVKRAWTTINMRERP